MIVTDSVSELRKKITNEKGIVVVLGGNEEINQTALSDKRVDILVSPERLIIKNYMHSRNSGINQVLAKLAYENQVAIGFDFNQVYNSKNKGLIIGRMMQNVKFCRKYKVRMVVGSFTKGKNLDSKSLQIFARFLGMTGGEAKKSISFKKGKDFGVSLVG